MKNKLITKDVYSHLKIQVKKANKIKMICPFISGSALFSYLYSGLEENINDEIELQILTTTYDGNSYMLDLDALKEFYNFKVKNINKKIKVEIKIEDPIQKGTRLHAKGYIFTQGEKDATFILGSSNFTTVGLNTGREWNVKVTSESDSEIIKDAIKEFDELFLNKDLIEINSDKIEELIKKKKDYTELLRLQKKAVKEIYSEEKIKLKSYQEKALQNINENRKNGINKNLVAMATGTGKTILACHDFIKYLEINPQASLLFIAHQNQIIKQAKEVFEKFIKKDFNPELVMEGRKVDLLNTNQRYFFANIKTLINRKEDLIKRKFDYIIFDEAHHIEAKKFKEVFNIIDNNNQILALTATPEREDGVNIQDEFFSGQIAFEYRTPEALKNGDLCDFDYWFIGDEETDFEGYKIQNKKNDKQVDMLISKTSRLRLLKNTIKKYIYDCNIDETSALIFCSSVENAKLTKEYLEKDYKVELLVSDDKVMESKKRDYVIDDFRNKKINFLCVVDIFNEGIDIPEINHIFLMRPTWSLTVYIQQLGRGLRLYPNKRLQIFDFVSNINYDFNRITNPIHKLNSLYGNLDTLLPLGKPIPKDYFEYVMEEEHGLSINFDKTSSKIIGDKLREFTEKRKWNSNYIELGFNPDFELFCKEADRYGSIYELYKQNDFRSIFNKINNVENLFIFFDKLLFLNNKEALTGFKEIILNSNPSNNYWINKLFISCFAFEIIITKVQWKEIELNNEIIKTNPNEEEMVNIILKKFSESLKKEIIYIINFLIMNENKYISNDRVINEMKDLKYTNMTYIQFMYLTDIIRLNDYEIRFDNNGCPVKGEIFTERTNGRYTQLINAKNKLHSNIENGEFNYIDNGSFIWPTPYKWKIDHKNKKELDASGFAPILFQTDLLAEYNNDVGYRRLFCYLGECQVINCKPAQTRGFIYKFKI